MIREEFSFASIKDYLYEKNDLLIAGIPGSEERSKFFFDNWMDKSKDVLLFKQLNDNFVRFQYYSAGIIRDGNEIDLNIGIPYVLKYFGVQEKNVLIDLSSLGHLLIMYLTKIILCQVIPKTLFASYIRPQKYSSTNLTDKILGVKSVPGFVKREKDKQILCSFIGFEGIRLKAIIEALHNIDSFVPIVEFPSGAPQWYRITMWNSMDVINCDTWDSTVYKCFSDSIIEAVNLLSNILILSNDKQVVLAPIGTRPHSMACAIYACNHANASIVYDYAVENEHRTEGISEITIYNLTSLLHLK